jgi:hypothetical protein
MKTLKLVGRHSVLFGLLAIIALGCSKSSDDETPKPKVAGVLRGEIKANRTLSADTIYTLQDFVYVTNGATITIPAGTIIRGDKATKGALIIEQGAKINATGTKEKPIVFTSSQPAGSRSYGDWGGLVLIGKAPHNRPSSTAIEGGIRGTLGTFSDANDNSGTLKYVRIEFAGIALTTVANSEINGLTMYGVGAGTTIDYVQVSYSGDDSYEWFGGTVNAKHLVAFRGFDDDWDTDWGWIGKVQYGLSLRDPAIADQSSSNGFESDNFNPGVPADGTNNGLPLTAPTFSNMSNFVTAGTPSNQAQSGSGPYQAGMHLRRNTSQSIFNSVLVGYPQGVRIDDATTYANITSGGVDLRGIVIANMTTPYTSGVAANVDVIKAFFETAGKGNRIADLTSLGLNANNFNLTAPSFLLQPSSSLLTGATFVGKAADSFFDKVTFIGAIGGTDDWTAGWTNFNPQTTDYSK